MVYEIDRRQVKNGSLTPAERTVARYMVAGLSYKQIARKLGISFRTVEDHAMAAMSKTKVTCRAALPLRLLLDGLITIEDLSALHEIGLQERTLL